MGQQVVYNNLREANIERNKIWDPDKKIGALFRAVEHGGEVGEVLNVIKKLERERLGIKGSRDTIKHLAEELADVIITCDLIAMEYGIDLDQAVEEKFNETSDKIGLPVKVDLTGIPF